MGLDTKTYWLTDWLTDCQSQNDFDFDLSLVLGQSPVGKNVSTETEDIVEIRHQATTDEERADWEHLVCAVVNYWVCELARAL
jgi:hypothetical protein